MAATFCARIILPALVASAALKDARATGTSAYYTNFSSSAEVLAHWTLSSGCEHCSKTSRDECNQMWPNASSFGALPGGVGAVHTTQHIDPSWSSCGSSVSSGHLVWNPSVLYGNFTTVAKWFSGAQADVMSATGFIGLDSPANEGSITLGFHGEGSPQMGTGRHGFQLGAYRNVSRSHHQQIIHTTEDLSASFNTFNVEWQPDSVTWRFNGRVVYVLDKLIDVPNQAMRLRLHSRSGWVNLMPNNASFQSMFLSFEYAPLPAAVVAS